MTVNRGNLADVMLPDHDRPDARAALHQPQCSPIDVPAIATDRTA